MNQRNQTATAEAPGPGQAVCASSPAVIPWSPTWAEVTLLPDFSSPPSHSTENPQVSLTLLSSFFPNFCLSIFHPFHHLPLRCKCRTSSLSFDSTLVSHTRWLTVGKWTENERQRQRVCVLQIRGYSLRSLQNKMRISAFLLTAAQRISILEKGCDCQHYPHLIFIIIPTFEQVSSNIKHWNWVKSKVPSLLPIACCRFHWEIEWNHPSTAEWADTINRNKSAKWPIKLVLWLARRKSIHLQQKKKVCGQQSAVPRLKRRLFFQISQFSLKPRLPIKAAYRQEVWEDKARRH